MQPLAIAPLPFLDAVRAAQARGAVLPQTYYGPRQALHRQVSFTVSRTTSLAQVRVIQENLNSAVAAGEDFAQWRKNILAKGVAALKLPNGRLETIYRTNVQSAYAAGREERALRIARTHPYLLYDAINDSRTRPGHLALDGFIFRVDDTEMRRKCRCPRGFNCRCRLVSLTPAQAEKRGFKPFPANAERDPGFEATGEENTAVQSLLRVAAKTNFQRPLEGVPYLPQGKPMQTFIRSLDPGVDEALFAISSVHGHDLPGQIVARQYRTQSSWLGLHRSIGNRPIEIMVRDEYKEFTATHEIGHAIDTALGDRMIAAAAIIQTATDMAAPRLAGGYQPEYWLNAREVWARVYSQWITERAGSEAMRKALERFQGVHWTPDEMQVLGPLLDRFFLQIGWVR